jgi:hypothetical protein
MSVSEYSRQCRTYSEISWVGEEDCPVAVDPLVKRGHGPLGSFGREVGRNVSQAEDLQKGTNSATTRKKISEKEEGGRSRITGPKDFNGQP